MTLDLTSGQPAYRQIADQLRAAILAGELQPSAKLTSERKLAEKYSVTQKTIREAVTLLREEGLVESRQGLGTFVRQTPKRRLAHERFLRRHLEAGRAAFLAEVEAEGSRSKTETVVNREPSSATVASRLGLREGDPVLVRRRRYYRNGEPDKISASYLPLWIVQGTPIEEVNPGPGGIYARLDELGYRLDHLVEEITTRMPRPDEARFLRLSRGVPVFALVKIAIDVNGVAVELYDSVMPGDRYTLVYRVPVE